jgi:RNA polymerase sigma-70 factor (ECF subfamily)
MADNREQEQAFDAYFRATRDRLVGQAFVLVGDLQDAQDLAQRALEQTWRHWPKIRRYERPDAWTRRVLFNLALNERRRWGREVPLGRADRASEDTPDDHLAIVAALRVIPVSQRKALVLHDAVGLTVSEIASELNAPEGTVKSWLHRGRAAIAEELNRDNVEQELRTTRTGSPSFATMTSAVRTSRLGMSSTTSTRARDTAILLGKPCTFRRPRRSGSRLSRPSTTAASDSSPCPPTSPRSPLRRRAQPCRLSAR